MKFFQIALFYDKYLQDFDRRHPGRGQRSFEHQQKLLFSDGFSACHYFAEGMAGLGHETMMVVANDRSSQEAWQRENRVEVAPPVISEPTGAWGQALPPNLLAILLAQTRQFEPDVLYLQDPISLDSRFLSLLQKKPRLVVAWRASEIPRKTDWTEIDLLVSNHEPSLRAGKARGARWQELLHPGFPQRLARAVEHVPESRDVVFSGQLSPLHRRRTELLTGLAMDQLRPGGKFELHYAVNTEGKTPAGVAMHAKEPVYGMEMYELLRSAKICLNIHAELAEKTGGNMRVFEATGIGSFLLTDLGRQDHGLFQSGREIETFRNQGELREKVLHYLQNPEERNRIAKAGQQKCLREFSLIQTAEKFEELIFRCLEEKGKNQSFRRWARFWPGLSSVPGQRPRP